MALHLDLQAFISGLRSIPIVVTSETAAREEASRQTREQSFRLQVDYLQSSTNAQATHRDVVNAIGPVTMR
jgi:hypothetical protein